MLFIGGALVSSAPTQPHTPHGLKPHKRRQSAAAPVYANVRIINE